MQLFRPTLVPIHNAASMAGFKIPLSLVLSVDRPRGLGLGPHLISHIELGWRCFGRFHASECTGSSGIHSSCLLLRKRNGDSGPMASQLRAGVGVCKGQCCSADIFLLESHEIRCFAGRRIIKDLTLVMDGELPAVENGGTLAGGISTPEIGYAACWD